MNVAEPDPQDAQEILELIETLHRTEQRITELTHGQVDSVADSEGRVFLLRSAQDHLRRTQASKQAAIIDALPAHIALVDGEGRIVSVNQRWREFAGSLRMQRFQLGVGACYLDVCERAHGEYSMGSHAAAVGLRSVLAGDLSNFSLEYACDAPSAERWFLMTVTPVATGLTAGAVVMHLDITERRLAEISIRQLNRLYSVLSGINTLIVRVGNRGELFSQACKIAVDQGGFSLALIAMVDAVAMTLSSVASAGVDAEHYAEVARFFALDAPDPYGVSIPARAIREKRAIVSTDLQNPGVLFARQYADVDIRSIAALPLMVADVAMGVLILYAREANFFHDAEMKLLSELAGDIAFAIDHIDKSLRLDYLAFYDALTALPNASLFKEHLDKFIHAARQDQGRVGVVVVDLERFTQINDSLGRGVGDELLRAVAARFRQYLVEPYALARIGADTFAVAAPNSAEVEPTALRDQILQALESTFSIGGRKLTVGAQAGIALYPTDGDDSDELFTNAETALKLAKTSGARFAYFSKALNARMELRFELAQQLREAVRAEQFVLHYQPRVDMISGEVVGAEALIRWQHPEHGLLAPTEFITLAEETGLMLPIGAWVLQHVCAQQAAWLAAGLAVVPVAANLSSVQFEKGDLVETVGNALAAHRLDAKWLDLELTESAVMNDSVAATVTLKALRKLGVGLALDDFGTGYSSLAHLKNFPFHVVKIDRSFVTDITSNVEDAAIAKAIITMAHGLKLKVIAEGVETQGQFNYLRALTCDEMQGFFYSMPVTAEVFAGQLRGQRRLLLPTPAVAEQRTLLMVDDEHSILSSLTRMLRRDGYRILHAHGGQEGLEMLALHDVQVIISDQRMVGMSGTEFLSKVSVLHPNTVRIILSGFTDLKVVTDAVNRGSVFKFLTKPWDDEQLREQVRDAFRRYRPEAAGVVENSGS